MKLSISQKSITDSTLIFVLDRLPIKIRNKLKDFLECSYFRAVNEIRIKRDANLYLIADSINVKTDIYVTREEIEEIFEYICMGSLYAYADTIKEGYVPLGCGVRAGICGNAVLDNGTIIGVKEISSINIRIPQIIKDASHYIYSLLKNEDFSKSILIYSLPGVGKTSILRDLIIKMNYDDSFPRLCVIDSKNEIITPNMKNLACDVYSAYPKGLGIELATKSMTPQIIICDEISSESDAKSVVMAANSGVRLIATTHSGSYEELKRREILKNLLKNQVFDYFIGVHRSSGEKKYIFTLNEKENV